MWFTWGLIRYSRKCTGAPDSERDTIIISENNEIELYIFEQYHLYTYLFIFNTLWTPDTALHKGV